MASPPDPRHSVLIAAAAAWARRFGVVPSSDARAIQDLLLREAPELLSAVNEALFHHSPQAFVDAVRRELVHTP